jgi:hypothetical protein
MKNGSLVRGIAVAAPISLVLWGILALTVLQAAESYRPGFSHDVKVAVYRAAGVSQLW